MKHRRLLKAISLILVVALSGRFTPAGARETYSETRKLLLEMRASRNSKQLTTLFRFGDERIHDLTKALVDSDEEVRRNAQVIIRYLGNRGGMDALLDRLNTTGSNNFVWSGPVPLPIHEVDYQLISARCSDDDPPRQCRLPSGYIFALALDRSDRATLALNRIIERKESFNEATSELRYVEVGVQSQLLTEADPAKAVLRNAFFMSANEHQIATSRLLGYNGAHNKALVEIYIDGGPLAEAWYHIVLSKHGEGWKFFSITLIAVS